MAQHRDFEATQEQLGPQLNQEQWAQENYDNSPHLVYKTGILFTSYLITWLLFVPYLAIIHSDVH